MRCRRIRCRRSRADTGFRFGSSKSPAWAHSSGTDRPNAQDRRSGGQSRWMNRSASAALRRRFVRAPQRPARVAICSANSSDRTPARRRAVYTGRRSVRAVRVRAVPRWGNAAEPARRSVRRSTHRVRSCRTGAPAKAGSARSATLQAPPARAPDRGMRAPATARARSARAAAPHQKRKSAAAHRPGARR